MISYHARRAAEYERGYQGPRGQDDLTWLRARVPEFFAGRRVFEVACGTVKNLLDRNRIERLIAPHAAALSYRELQFSWVLEYKRV
jgi:hypothetical protein